MLWDVLNHTDLQLVASCPSSPVCVHTPPPEDNNLDYILYVHENLMLELMKAPVSGRLPLCLMT